MFGQLYEIIAPVLICAALGYAWHKAGGPFHAETVTMVVTNVGAPCLIFGTLTRLDVSPHAFGQMALAAVSALAVYLALGAAVLRIAGLPVRTFLPSLTFGNTGNTGLPLCLFAFGQPGLALAIAYFTINSLGQFTIGALINAGSFSARRLARTPVIYAITLALAFMIAEAKPPAFVMNTVGLLGNLAIPLMLMALGISLAGLRVEALGQCLLLALYRLSAGLVVGVGLSELFGFTGAARGVLIIQAAMPTAVFNFLFATYFKRDSESVAGMVVVSTLATFACLPLILALALDPSLLPWRDG